MAVYTDGVHLVADTLDELLRFVDKISLSRERIQGIRKKHVHFDLLGRKLQAALDAGAIDLGRNMTARKQIATKAKSLSEQYQSRRRFDATISK